LSTRFAKLKSDNSKYNEALIYSKLITSILYMTVTSYYGGSSVLFLVYVIYKCIFSKTDRISVTSCISEVQQALRNAQQDWLVSDSTIGTGFRELLNPQHVCS
jgi:hypothetical protein